MMMFVEFICFAVAEIIAFAARDTEKKCKAVEPPETHKTQISS